jgi:hypothetical protein
MLHPGWQMSWVEERRVAATLEFSPSVHNTAYIRFAAVLFRCFCAVIDFPCRTSRERGVLVPICP